MISGEDILDQTAVVATNLGDDDRTRTDNFKHLERLAGLIPAYIATVVEVIRRREFGELF